MISRLRRMSGLARTTALCLAVLLSGCAGISPNAMVPDSAPSRQRINLTVRVPEVAWYPGEVVANPVNGEAFRDALVKTLTRMDLFSAVLPDGQADLELRAQILFQRQWNMFPSYRAMTVDYSLIDVSRKSTIWNQEFDTRGESSDLGGYRRSVEAAERCGKANIAAMLGELEKFLATLRR